jgi:hypothetical protein
MNMMWVEEIVTAVLLAGIAWLGVLFVVALTATV